MKPACILVLTLIVGCERPVPPAAAPRVSSATALPADSSPRAANPSPVPAVTDSLTRSPSLPTAPRGPAATLAAYLAGKSYRAATVPVDSFEWCPPPDPDADVAEGWEPDEYIAIEQPRVLTTLANAGDSAATSQEVRAEVVQLVDVTREGQRWVARVNAVTDTLSWTLVRRPSGEWSVCGPAKGGLGDLRFLVNDEFARRGEINAPTWVPPGSSWDAVARMADSVRAQLPTR